jgi:hypothetical protein
MLYALCFMMLVFDGGEGKRLCNILYLLFYKGRGGGGAVIGDTMGDYARGNDMEAMIRRP